MSSNNKSKNYNYQNNKSYSNNKIFGEKLNIVDTIKYTPKPSLFLSKIMEKGYFTIEDALRYAIIKRSQM
jgi:hypothetical protein